MAKQLEEKEIRINVRTREDIKRDAEIVADLNGLTMAALVNLLLRTKIREEKAKDPDAFPDYSQGRPLAPHSARRMKASHHPKEVKRKTG